MLRRRQLGALYRELDPRPCHDCDFADCERCPPGHRVRRLSMYFHTFCSFHCLVRALEAGHLDPAKFVGPPRKGQLQGDLPS